MTTELPEAILMRLLNYKFICVGLPTGLENIGWISKFGV